jgi:hypothetical protein
MNTQLKSVSRTLLAVALATAAMSSASAQRNRRPDPFNTTMEGRGTVHFNGATYSFHQLQLTLQKNQRVTVHALLYASDSKDVILTGKVSDFGRRTSRLSADIDAVSYGRDTDSAEAMCDIDLTSNGRFNTVTITGSNTTDHNNISLDFVSNGKEVTDFQRPNGDRIYDQYGKDRDRNRGGGNNGHDDNRSVQVAGRYADSDEWRKHGQHFLVRYSLELRRQGDARLVVSSVEDRDMPDDKDSRFDHGDILKYLQRGQDVMETGQWVQDGDRVTITLDRVQYGETSRPKKEVLRGRMRNGTLWIDDYEKSFYGHNVSLSFERA